MVLAFLRVDSTSTDYVFKEHDLDEIVRDSIKRFSTEFIERKINREKFVREEEKFFSESKKDDAICRKEILFSGKHGEFLQKYVCRISRRRIAPTGKKEYNQNIKTHIAAKIEWQSQVRI